MTPRGQCVEFLTDLEAVRQRNPRLEIVLPTQSLVFP